MNALMGLEQQELVTLSIFFGRFRKLQVIGCDALTSNCCQDNDLLRRQMNIVREMVPALAFLHLRHLCGLC
jgi:hypothetical protein